MPVSPNEAFLRLVWTHGLYTRLDPPGIEVIDPGSAGPEDGIDAVNARIALEGTEISGPVAIHERASDCTTSTANTTAASCMSWHTTTRSSAGRTDRSCLPSR